ncbi:DUF4352 domain-containing protein [Exiguobacterium aurantiacum]|uniref:DUF4352 domain-containing protein n=1 Tax=Exiguobacterium aurantiacum TaxID=33987 RepID=A0ABY5FQC2_9BACL|nr:DUF4352 domain-containing protein [Exiguobacterium aurantiacum]UTT43796.1 DUF4352 domain-containing protein [Exiguobacterium aurantiacum]
MNMKRYGFLFALPLALLVGCGEEAELASSTAPTEQTEDVKEQKAEKQAETVVEENAEVYDSEIGINTIHMKNTELTMNETMGSVQFNVNKIQTSRLNVAEDYLDMFDGKDEVTLVVVNVTAENTVDDTIHFYPDQGTLVTNTGEQIDANLWFSDDVGGDFLGKVKKEGNVMFMADAMPEELTEVRFIVGGPTNTDYEKLAEESYEYKIDVTK